MRGGTIRPLAVALVAATGVALGGGTPTGVTKVAPTAAEPGHPFTLIDTESARLVEGSIALLRLDGTLVAVPLETHKPYKTAHGEVPAGTRGGTYRLSVRRPDGTEFEVGPFVVLGETAVVEPSIQPLAAPVFAPFTITDPLGRMAGAEVVVFFPEGASPAEGQEVGDLAVSPDGGTATGTVPAGVSPYGVHFVTVHARSKLEPPLFNALAFTATSPRGVPAIAPTCAGVQASFTLTDAEARLRSADRIVFTPPGRSTDSGVAATNVGFASNGTAATGTVPASPSTGLHFVSAHAGPAAGSPPLFPAVAFYVDCPRPAIVPTAGPVGTNFVIVDPLGRMLFAQAIVFSPEGTSPSEGHRISDAAFSPDGTIGTGTLPGVLAVGAHSVTVHHDEFGIDVPLFGAVGYTVGANASVLVKGVRNVSAGEAGFASATEARGGDTVEFELVYVNAGGGVSSDVTVSDDVPPGFVFEGCSGGCTLSQSDAVVWSLGETAGGERRSLTFRAILASGVAGGFATNVATVDTRAEEPVGSNPATVSIVGG